MDHRLAGRYRKRNSKVLTGGLSQVDTGEGSVEVGLRVGLEAKQTPLVHVEFNAAGRVKVGKVNLAVVPSEMAPLDRSIVRIISR